MSTKALPGPPGCSGAEDGPSKLSEFKAMGPSFIVRYRPVTGLQLWREQIFGQGPFFSRGVFHEETLGGGPAAGSRLGRWGKRMTPSYGRAWLVPPSFPSHSKIKHSPRLRGAYSLVDIHSISQVPLSWPWKVTIHLVPGGPVPTLSYSSLPQLPFTHGLGRQLLS